MFAFLMLHRALGTAGSSILAISYDPPLRTARRAPSNVRQIAALAESAGLAVELSALIAALPRRQTAPAS